MSPRNRVSWAFRVFDLFVWVHIFWIYGTIYSDNSPFTTGKPMCKSQVLQFLVCAKSEFWQIFSVIMLLFLESMKKAFIPLMKHVCIL